MSTFTLLGSDNNYLQSSFESGGGGGMSKNV